MSARRIAALIAADDDAALRDQATSPRRHLIFFIRRCPRIVDKNANSKKKSPQSSVFWFRAKC